MTRRRAIGLEEDAHSVSPGVRTCSLDEDGAPPVFDNSLRWFFGLQNRCAEIFNLGRRGRSLHLTQSTCSLMFKGHNNCNFI